MVYFSGDNIGRGFIAEPLQHNGDGIVLIDNSDSIVSEREKRKFSINIKNKLLIVEDTANFDTHVVGPEITATMVLKAIDTLSVRDSLAAIVCGNAIPGDLADSSPENKIKTAQYPRITEYPCITQYPISSYGDLQLGEHDEIYRWEYGSTVTYTIDDNSFPNQEDAKYALDCLSITLKEWQNHQFGLKFKYLAPGSTAAFTLVYRADIEDAPPRKPNNVLARAFFPSAPPDKRMLFVYQLSFTDQYRDYLQNVLRHESAHIIGLRHWDAEWKERGMKSVCFPANADNERSVMGPFDHLRDIRIHHEDVDSLKKLYALEAGTTIKGFKIVDVTP